MLWWLWRTPDSTKGVWDYHKSNEHPISTTCSLTTDACCSLPIIWRNPTTTQGNCSRKQFVIPSGSWHTHVWLTSFNILKRLWHVHRSYPNSGILKQHGIFVAYYCKIILYRINYTYYRDIDVLVHRSHRLRGVFETVVGLATIRDGNVWSRDALSHEHKLPCGDGFLLTTQVQMHVIT